MTLLDAGAASTPWLSLLQALSAFALVLLLVWLGRKKLAQGGVFGKRSERMSIEERLPIDLANALLVVRVEDRRLLLSVSNQGPARLLVELAHGGGTTSAIAAPQRPLEADRDHVTGQP